MRNASPAYTPASHVSMVPRFLGSGLAVRLPSPRSMSEEWPTMTTVSTEESETMADILLICPKYAEVRRKGLHDPRRGEISQRVRTCVIPSGSERQKQEARKSLLGIFRETSIIE